MRVNHSYPDEFLPKEQMPYITISGTWEEMRQLYKENFQGIEDTDAEQRKEIWPVSHELAKMLQKIFKQHE